MGRGFDKFPCEICGTPIGKAGGAKYNHGMMHVRKKEARVFLKSGRWEFEKVKQ